VIGVKTGFTSNAGMSLVAYVDDDPDFVTVVLNAEDRYEESKVLIQGVRQGFVCY
jgi:D-alanyl-D-alanine carboxypeptidase